MLDETVLGQMEIYSERLPSILRSFVDQIEPDYSKSNLIYRQLIELYFGGYMQIEGTKFEFPPGHKTLLISMVQIVRNIVQKDDISFFKMNTVDGIEINCGTIRTPVGILYYDYDDSKLQRKRKNCHGSPTVSFEKVEKNNITDSVKRLKEYLEASLLLSLKKTVNKLKSPADLQFLAECKVDSVESFLPAMVEVVESSIKPVLIKLDLMVPDENAPNPNDINTITGIVKCFCSALRMTTEIRVPFQLQKPTGRMILGCMLQDATFTPSAVHNHFMNCWNFYSFERHHKTVHMKHGKKHATQNKPMSEQELVNNVNDSAANSSVSGNELISNGK